MSITHSMADEEKRSIEFDKHSTDHLGGALVSKFFILFALPWVAK
jgi:hypothetical protein